MNWKLLLACMLTVILGYVIYMGVSFWLAGNPFTITGFITYIGTSTMLVVNSITVFIQDKWQSVIVAGLGAIGGIITAIKAIQSKISGIKQTAQAQVSDVQSQATQQYVDMKATITKQEDTITSLQTQVQDQSTLTTKITTLQTAYDQKEVEVQKLIAEKNAIQQSSLSQIVVKCRTCGQDYLKWQLTCPTCKTPQAVVA